MYWILATSLVGALAFALYYPSLSFDLWFAMFDLLFFVSCISLMAYRWRKEQAKG